MHIVIDVDFLEVTESLIVSLRCEVLIGLLILLKTVFGLLTMVPRHNNTADDMTAVCTA